MAYTLPKLPYAYDALEPHIDAVTMEIHYTKHHQTYINNVNAALEKAGVAAPANVDDLVAGLDKLSEELKGPVRNNGGGHYNHSLFWEVIGPNGNGAPSGKLAAAIDSSFGSFDEFIFDRQPMEMPRGPGPSNYSIDRFSYH